MEEDNDGEIVENVVSEDENESESSSDSSDDDTQGVDPPTWSPAPGATGGFRDIPFTGHPGLRIPIPGNNSPIDWFKLLFDVVLMEQIIAQTNRYAFEVFSAPSLTPKSRICKFKDVCLDEFIIFIGLLLHTGTIRLNRLNDYWKTHHLFNLTAFSQYMSRDRFLVILRCLHFSKPATAEHPVPANNRTYKISLFVDYLNNKMKQIYNPSRELTIDEEMVLWRGRLVFRQYIKGKRHKYGIKIYSLNEPEGLMLRFHVYTGKYDPCGGKGHTVKVVMKLMTDFLGLGHSLFMDNFYNSFLLSSKLLRRRTYSTGTLRSDRKFTPEAVKSAQLAKGGTVANYAESIMVGKWRDKRRVLYISSEFDNDMVKSTNKRKQVRTLPKPVMQYNAHMKGVDRLDQMLAYYPCERKTLRWHKKMFVHFLQVCMVNAYYLHNMYNPNQKLSLYDFRLKVLEALLPPKQAPLMVTPTRNSLHRLSKNDKRRANGTRVAKLCRVCSKEGKRKQTVYICGVCPDEPGLCELRCFDKYHEEVGN